MPGGLNNVTNTSGTTNQLQNALQNLTTNQTQGVNTTTDTAGLQTHDPYAAAAPNIQDILNQAGQLYGQSNAIGPSAAGSPLNAAYLAQMGMGQQLQGSAADPYYRALGTMTGSAMDPWTTTSLTSQSAGLNPQIQALNNLSNDPALSSLSQNTSGALTSTQQAILDQNADRLSNRLASQYSGAGRTGSFGAGIGLARGIAETNNPLIAQFSQQSIQNALNAMGQRGQLSQAALGGQQALQNLSAQTVQGFQNRGQQSMAMAPALQPRQAFSAPRETSTAPRPTRR